MAEPANNTRLRLGDLLIRANLVTEQQVAAALDRMRTSGGRLGDNLVALQILDQTTLDNFLHRVPSEPLNTEATGIDKVDLMSLLLKLIYHDRLETTRQFIEAIKLPYPVVLDLVQTAVDRQLLQTMGSRYSDNPIDLAYSFTETGKRWTIDALERQGYVGPAPVTLEQFNEQVCSQKLTNEVIGFDRVRRSIGDLTFDDRILEACGPALNSGRALLLYGPPGNGKTSVARCFASVFSNVIYIPYAVMVEGQVIRVFDPTIHVPVRAAGMSADTGLSFVRRDEYDARWVPCSRPFVVTGGELTLEMLDLRFDEVGKFYEAPLHMKALGGCLIIDDFGRQLVSPKNLLNRWIVPLENRVDFLKLHTGKTFSIPFEELVIFSTNLEPEDLMDPAFLRRLPYKVEIGAPSLENFKRIFAKECARQQLIADEDVVDYVVYKIRHEKKMDSAAYMPRFIVDQIVTTCQFMEQEPHFEVRFIDYAVDNLRVKRGSSSQMSETTEEYMESSWALAAK